jgi:hypothetical protein
MTIYLSEGEIRKIIREGLYKDAFSNSEEGSITSKNSLNKNLDINFEFEAIPDQAAVKKANEELTKWGGKNEKEASVRNTLKGYWDNLRGVFSKNADQAIASNEPWSGAFISFVMNNPFFKSAAHNTWKEKAEKNTQDINNNPENYIGKEMYIALSNDGNVNLDLGDNVWKPREGGSHSDIVVSPTEAIGGNLSNTVKKVKIDHPIVIKKVRILGPKNKN